MRVKVWGARGSIPTPIRPEEIKEKITLAMLGISNIADNRLKEELVAALLEQPQVDEPAELFSERLAKQRNIIFTYLDSLPALLSGTAGGNTPCVEIRSGDDLFIIDAGSGIRELGLELMKGPCGQGQGVIHLLFSHPHWDHIQGFPFFRPAFVPGNRIYLYAVHNMEAALKRQQEAISFPISLDYMQADMEFIQLKPDKSLKFGDLRIRCLRNHHPGDAYSFRFEKGNRAFVYASDASYPPGIDLRPYLNFFEDADVLIYDAQFTQRESDEKEDWGHSSSFVGVEMAQQVGVKNLLLFHYDPTYSDEELKKILEDTLKFQINQYPDQQPVKVMIAQEGQTFDLTPLSLSQLRQVPGSQAAILEPNPIFDERTVTELREQLAELQKESGPPQLIIEMSKVDMLQITGLRALIKLKKEQPGMTVTLTGPNTNVQQLIELAGYSDFFTIYPSVHTALSKLQAHETLNLPGQMLKNRYYVKVKKGDGRLGTVFTATDTRLNRPVAIKVLSHAFSEAAIEQFLQHGRQIVDLSHPNIVEVYDCDQDHGLYFMVEELIESKTLRDIIDEQAGQPLQFSVALNIAENMARALEYAHVHRVIHGDLKPKNVLLAERIAISDFGLGRLESGKPLLLNETTLVLGTAHYLAPEQILGHPIDGRTDLYALGVILYEIFTGQRPFEGSDKEILEHHRYSDAASPRELNPNISHTLEHLILKLLDKDPNQRYATARQVRRILSSMSSTISGNRDSQTFNHQPRYPLVGRAEQLHQLQNLWKKASQGQGQLVFISGECGIGKSRLARELVQRVERGTVLIGQCRKTDGNGDYCPFTEAINSYLANVPEPDKLANTPVSQVLARIAQFIPQIQLLLPKTVAPQKTQSPTPAPSSLAHIMAPVNAERPWLLILDDLHWANQSSLRLLRYLAQHCTQMNLMIIGLYQNDTEQENIFLAEIINTINRQNNCTSVALERFTGSQVTEMLIGIWSQTVPADLAETIHRRTKGNPLFVTEIVRMLMDENVVSWRDTRWHFGPIVEASLPDQIREAILRRVHRLPEAVQTLLTQATVLGASFFFGDLQEMSSIGGKDALDNLDVALERQLIRQAPGETSLHFNHIEIQKALYENQSPLKRALIHRQAGEALERRHQTKTKNVSGILAFHFLQAGDLKKGLAYSLQAATQAKAVLNYHKAIAWYSQALDALDQLDPEHPNHQQRLKLLLEREQIYNYLGNQRAQAADLATLKTLVQTIADPAGVATVHNRWANYYRHAGRLAQGKTEAEAALKAARIAKNSLLENYSLTQLAAIGASHGQLQTALNHMHSAHNVLDKTGNQEYKARSLSGLAIIYQHLNDYDQAETYCQQALALNRTAGSWPGQAISISIRGRLSLGHGNYSSALVDLQHALSINQLIGMRRGAAICLNQLAVAYQELGQVEMAQKYIKEALAIHHLIGDQPGEAEDLKIWGTIFLARGESAAARDYIGEALEIFNRLGFRLQEGDTWLELGLAQELLGDVVKATTAYGQAQTIQQSVGSKNNDLDARTGLVRCHLTENRIDKARTEIETCLEELKRNGTAGVKYPIRLHLTAYRVFLAADDKKMALVALEEGYALLQKRRRKIKDANLQASFLENVPENKDLLIQVERQTIN